MRLATIREPLMELQLRTRWINPDIFYARPGSTTFFYTANGELQTVPGGVTHVQVIEDDPSLQARYDGPAQDRLANDPEIAARIDDGEFQPIDILRLVAEDQDLLGRIGQHELQELEWKTVTVVSFWNRDQTLYDRLLRPCLRAMVADGVIDNNAVVSTPAQLTFVKDLLQTSASMPAVDQQTTQAAQQQQMLHLLNSPQKRQALQQQGYQGSQKSAMQRAVEKAGLIQPGQKWWAQYSEDVL